MKRTILLLCLAPVMLIAQSKAASTAEYGYLKVAVTPDKAGVFLDGVYMGPAARFARTLKYRLLPGKYEITMSDPRCEDATETVTIEAGKTATITKALTQKPEPKGPFGTLKVESPHNVAAVLLNGHYVGHVDEFDNCVEGLMLPPGSYNLLIEVAGGEAMLSQKVTIEANKTTVVQQDVVKP